MVKKRSKEEQENRDLFYELVKGVTTKKSIKQNKIRHYYALAQ